MTFDRHTLAERLRPHLSPTEPRLASELLVLAGVQTGSRVGGVVAAALQELRAAGHARPAGGTRQALRWLASAPGDLGSETLPLARLDATVTLTTTARTTAGGTKRTELAATVTLGPSWPAGTCPASLWTETDRAYREVLSALTLDQLDTAGPQACEMIEALLSSAPYPDLPPTEPAPPPALPCVPPPPPAAPTVRSPSLGERLEALQLLARASEHLISAAALLPEHREQLAAILVELELLGCHEQGAAYADAEAQGLISLGAEVSDG